MSAPTTIANPVELFDRRYRLLSLLGQGHAGEVWRAEDTTTGRTVALKVLDGTKTTPDAAWKEATRLTSLESPYLVRVHGAALAVDTPYLDMELALGGTAADHSAPLGVTADMAVRWTRQVAQGLHLCHQRGLLHRDVKPENVFLDDKQDARLGDFGTAAVQGPTGSASVGGDPQVRAPEVLKGGDCTVRSDVYSIGITLYSFLTGRLPHRWIDHGSFRSLKAAALGGPPDIRTVAPHVDRALAAVVRTATSLTPTDRFASVGAMDNALGRLRSSLRAVKETVPHSGCERCWDARPTAPRGGTDVHVCLLRSGRRFKVLTRHVASGNRITSCCRDQVPAGQAPVFLRKVFSTLS